MDTLFEKSYRKTDSISLNFVRSIMDDITAVFRAKSSGKGKNNRQIYSLPNAYIADDDIEYGVDNKIPLWIFGFLY
jgi:hypothetical protein